MTALFFRTAVAEEEPVIPPDNLVYCTVCHGVQLRGNAVIEAPRLSGMEPWYVERQLEAFRQGWRGGHQRDEAGLEMQPMAAALSDAEVEAAVRYVSAVESEPPPVTINGDADSGRELYSTCAACHGVQGEGNESLGGPSLTGLNDWYLVTQLRNYRAGARGNHPDDTYGAQMRAAAALLGSDDEIDDVVFYLTTLQSKQETDK